MAHHHQTQHFASMLGQAQKDHAAQRAEMERSVKDANFQMAKAKRDQDAADARYQALQAASDVATTENHDFMTENPATEQSMLAPHRVKPYHFKGFNNQQKQAVLDERNLQLKEA